MSQMSLFQTEPAKPMTWPPTRKAGLARLDAFVAQTGGHYARTRNFDLGPDTRTNVSALSPWIRRRLITEEDVLRAVLQRHSPSAAEKFIQEVFWRTYFKGWLEQRPSVWTSYQSALTDLKTKLDDDYHSAIRGETGIDCFDAWAKELVTTGYLHNHARMWFASIWIFTLRLPWQLGADFFLTHLLDGDPASNTLSWRWVGGLHTKGKTYLARASNIAKYTEGRFNPEGQLATSAPPLVEDREHPIIPVTSAEACPPAPYGVLITPEDCSPETLNLPQSPRCVSGLTLPSSHAAAPVQSFAQEAVKDAVTRAQNHFACPATYLGDWDQSLITWAEEHGVSHLVTAYAPIGPVADALEAADIKLHRVRRSYDTLSWPHATKGFFKLKTKIPNILADLGLS